MKNKQAIYNIINIVVLFATVAFFVGTFQNVGVLFGENDMLRLVLLSSAVLVVHFLKAVRTYVLLYGADMDWITYLKLYCKVTAVSVIFPFKTGEFFRMYCYGTQINNLLKGIIIVLLDRFMDTVALITMIFLVWLMNGGQIALLTYILLVFLVLVFLAYMAFPSVYKFWIHHILRAKATERSLTLLKFLDMIHKVYQEITAVSVGRGIILYGLSLIAWGVEIGGLILLCGRKEELSNTISSYLSATMGGSVSVEMSRFIFVSAILLVSVYAILKIADCLKRGKVNK